MLSGDSLNLSHTIKFNSVSYDVDSLIEEYLNGQRQGHYIIN